MQTDDIRDYDLLPELPLGMELELKPTLSFDALLPKPKDMKLSTSEIEELAAVQASFIILGPAAGAVLVCPGNQEDLTEDQKCPYAAKCPLLKAKKAPEGSLCPIERAITEQRFIAWCREVGQEPATLTEDARIIVSDLVWLDLQEQRCVNILAAGQAARLTQVNVTEAISFTTGGDATPQVLPLTWERVLHVNTARLDMIQQQRRMLMKDWMMTPEQKWKKAKSEGKTKGKDLGSTQSVIGDKLRQLDPTFE